MNKDQWCQCGKSKDLNMAVCYECYYLNGLMAVDGRIEYLEHELERANASRDTLMSGWEIRGYPGWEKYHDSRVKNYESSLEKRIDA